MVACIHRIVRHPSDQLSQLGETFLSRKHLDYLAVIAEFWSEVQA